MDHAATPCLSRPIAITPAARVGHCIRSAFCIALGGCSTACCRATCAAAGAVVAGCFMVVTSAVEPGDTAASVAAAEPVAAVTEAEHGGGVAPPIHWGRRLPRLSPPVLTGATPSASTSA